MLGESTFDRCYAYLRANKRAKKAAEELGGVVGAAAGAPIPSESDQERTVKSWFKSAEQATAYSHIQSLIFCEDLMAKM